MAQVAVSRLETWHCNHCPYQLVITRPWEGIGGAKQQAAGHIGNCKQAAKNQWIEASQRCSVTGEWIPPERGVEANGELLAELTFVLG